MTLAVAALGLASCSTNGGVAKAACPEIRTMALEDYPAAIMLPPGSVIEQRTHGQPPEYASDNYAIVANIAETPENILPYYRCALPSRNLSIISEEQGNIMLVRFAGEGIDDGSITLGEGIDKGGTRIEIFVIANAG